IRNALEAHLEAAAIKSRGLWRPAKKTCPYGPEEERYVPKNLPGFFPLEGTGVRRPYKIPGALCLVHCRPRLFLGRRGAPHRLDQALYESEKYQFWARLRFDQMVRGRDNQCRAKLHRPALATARTPYRDPLGRRRAKKLETHHLSGTARPGLPPRQCAQSQGRQQGRHRHDLSADDSRGDLSDTRVRKDRRDPLRGFCRLLARFACRTDCGLPIKVAYYGR